MVKKFSCFLCMFGLFISILKADNDTNNYFDLVEQFQKKYTEYSDKNKFIYESIVADNIKLYSALIGKKWGDNNILLSAQKNTTYYSDDLQSRENIDYEKGTVKIEILASKKPSPDVFSKALNDLKENSISKKIKNELIFKGVDLQIDKKYENLNKEIIPKYNFESKDIREKIIHKDRKIYFIEKTLVSGYIKKMAKIYYPDIKHYAKKYGVDESFILGVIHTESSFNARAISPVPAFGLMQLVPKTGGLDAYVTLTGKKIIPSANYLYNPKKNIELGVVYINKIQNFYLNGVKNKNKLNLSTSIAYNAGIGTLYKSFSKSKSQKIAVDEINLKNYDALYKHFKNTKKFTLEAREYIDKVEHYSNLWKKILDESK